MKSQHAVTLIEVMITFLIMAILMGISLPTVRHFLDDENDKLVLSQVLKAIQFAHLEARAKRIPVVVCKSNNQTTCSGSWSDGMLIFMDEDESGIVNNKQQVITSIVIKKRNRILRWRSFPYYRDHLLFLPTGLTGNDNGTFWYCRINSLSPIWAIIISKSGRVRVIYPDQESEIKDDSGKSLRCDKD